MKQLFVPYELALLAKENGFHEDCLGMYAFDHYDTNKYIYLSYDDGPVNGVLGIMRGEYTRAPLCQQLVDWLREQHEIYVVITTEAIDTDEEEFVYEIRWNKNPDEDVIHKKVEYIRSFGGYGATYYGAWRDYYAAFDAALIKALSLITNK